jgi:hypothetical protein
MKRCPYCGAEYPDSATECAIDRTLFEKPEHQPSSFKLPDFGILSEQKIPVSLSLVSYCFFIQGASLIALCVFFPFLFTFLAGDGNLYLSLIFEAFFVLFLLLMLLMFPKIILFVSGIFILGYLFLHPVNTSDTIWTVAGFGYTVATIFISRGLRRCSPGWRTCALLSLWFDFASLTYGSVYWLLKVHGGKAFSDYAPWEYAVGIAYVFFKIWQYRVLTRPDVRELFGL